MVGRGRLFAVARSGPDTEEALRAACGAEQWMAALPAEGSAARLRESKPGEAGSMEPGGLATRLRLTGIKMECCVVNPNLEAKGQAVEGFLEEVDAHPEQVTSLTC